MSKYLLNFANGNYKRNQFWSSYFARNFAGFDGVIECDLDSIDDDFRNAHDAIFREKKGAGYWLWKPYLILKFLKLLNEDDVLVYSDSGSIFFKNINPLLETMDFERQCVYAFDLPFVEKQWTKSEVIEYLEVKNDAILLGSQINAAFIFVKNNRHAISFFEKYLLLCSNYNLINDNLGECIEDSCFIAHRHDQSLFSLLYKLSNYESICDRTQFGLFPEFYSPNSGVTLNHSGKSVRLMINLSNKINFSDWYIFHHRSNVWYIAIFKFITKYIIKKFCWHMNIHCRL